VQEKATELKESTIIDTNWNLEAEMITSDIYTNKLRTRIIEEEEKYMKLTSKVYQVTLKGEGVAVRI
jgi:hypothetical protein